MKLTLALLAIGTLRAADTPKAPGKLVEPITPERQIMLLTVQRDAFQAQAQALINQLRMLQMENAAILDCQRANLQYDANAAKCHPIPPPEPVAAPAK